MDNPAVREVVVAFPAFAASIIILLTTALILLLLWIWRRTERDRACQVRKLNDQIRAQDGKLQAIHDLIASEVRELRESHHGLEKRLIVVESRCAITHGSAQ